ncbi:MAG: ankyrin repeat domain-containing protein [Acinetobacter sp.]|uniref:ankyrin repeat domain-containing protein n=1 Tax=Acinetobacter sp. TaxID=472 RepID=UPI000FB40AD9|nr:ankyrin repeat domain-containing protein [Acinetobacter sp.]RUP42003.1 MAG: ankyrin repeat domain-containing protein [Acinetobacter sp.]
MYGVTDNQNMKSRLIKEFQMLINLQKQKGDAFKTIYYNFHVPVVTIPYFKSLAEKLTKYIREEILSDEDVKEILNQGDNNIHTFLYKTIESIDYHHMVEFLIGHFGKWINFNYTNNEGNNFLHAACGIAINWDAAQILVKLGTDTTLQNKEGETPIDFASKKYDFGDDELFEVQKQIKEFLKQTSLAPNNLNYSSEIIFEEAKEAFDNHIPEEFSNNNSHYEEVQMRIQTRTQIVNSYIVNFLSNNDLLEAMQEVTLNPEDKNFSSSDSEQYLNSGESTIIGDSMDF